MADDARREAATVTFVVSASGVAVIGISAPFWGLAAGLVLLAMQRLGTGRAPSQAPRAGDGDEP
jgi:benzoate membrane transport protein